MVTLMKNPLRAVCYFLLFCVLLRACGIIVLEDHKHEWQQATCTQPRTCSGCGETDGEPLGHDWQEATCLVPETCRICGATRGELAAHIWISATCTNPQTCSVCGETIGEPLGHSWVSPTFDTPFICSSCGEESGDPLPPYAYSRGRYDRWSNTPSPSQFVGMSGYVAVAYDSFLYDLSDSPYDNDWFSTPWKASIYEKDKQFWNVIGTVDHKTAVTVIDQELTPGSHGTYRYNGYLLVQQISNGKQFYLSITDFVLNPYWESSDIGSILSSGPFLAEYHQISDFYPTDSKDKRADVKDGEIVLVCGITSGGAGFGDPETNPVAAISSCGRCYFNASDLSIVY